MRENRYYEEIEDTYLAETYQKIPVLAASGKGAHLWDLEGNEYLDFMSGYGMAILGHSFPAINDAIREQAEQITITHASMYSPARAIFLKELSEIVPSSMRRAILSNSGTESVEAAVKIALKSTGRTRIVSMENGYHGKTMASLSLTHAPKYRKSFKEALIPSVEFHKFGETNQLEKSLKSEEVAAVFLEPVQGEGGINIPPDDYLKSVRELTEETGTLLVMDEIQSGLGRTGKMWAHEHWKVTPDVMTIGKGIGGGIPMGVTVGKPEFVDTLTKGEQSSTTGGNPLACAAGTAVIRALKDGFVDAARDSGKYLLSRMSDEFTEHRLVASTRGLGMMIALELRVRFLPVLMNMIQGGLITLYSGIKTIRMLPPYIVSEEEMERALTIVKTALDRQLESARSG